MVCSFSDTSLYMTIPQIWDTFEMRASINYEITFGGPDPRLSSTYDSSIIWAFNPLEVRTRSKGNVEPSPNFHGHRHLIVVAHCVHDRLVSATESMITISSHLKALADVAGTRDEVRDGLIGGRGHLRLSGVLLSGKFINDASKHLF